MSDLLYLGCQSSERPWRDHADDNGCDHITHAESSDMNRLTSWTRARWAGLEVVANISAVE